MLQDPLTRTLNPANGNYTSTPFPGNIIPSSRFDKNSVFLINKFDPLPNITQQTTGLPLNNYQYPVKVPVDKDQVTERIDFNESANSQWFGRYSWTDESQISPGLTTDFVYESKPVGVVEYQNSVAYKSERGPVWVQLDLQRNFAAAGQQGECGRRNRSARGNHRSRFLGCTEYFSGQQSYQPGQSYLESFFDQR